MARPGLSVALPMAKRQSSAVGYTMTFGPDSRRRPCRGLVRTAPGRQTPHPPCRAVGGAWSGFLTPVAPDAGRPAGLMPKATAFAGRAAGPVRPLRRQCRI